MTVMGDDGDDTTTERTGTMRMMAFVMIVLLLAIIVLLEMDIMPMKRMVSITTEAMMDMVMPLFHENTSST